MDVEDSSPPTPAPAPASETKQETKEEDNVPWRWMQVPRPKSLVFLLTRMLQMEGSSLEEVSSGQPGSSSRPSKAGRLSYGRGNPLDGPNRAQGSLR